MVLTGNLLWSIIISILTHSITYRRIKEISMKTPPFSTNICVMFMTQGQIAALIKFGGMDRLYPTQITMFLMLLLMMVPRKLSLLMLLLILQVKLPLLTTLNQNQEIILEDTISHSQEKILTLLKPMLKLIQWSV